MTSLHGDSFLFVGLLRCFKFLQLRPLGGCRGFGGFSPEPFLLDEPLSEGLTRPSDDDRTGAVELDLEAIRKVVNDAKSVERGELAKKQNRTNVSKLSKQNLN